MLSGSDPFERSDDLNYPNSLAWFESCFYARIESGGLLKRTMLDNKKRHELGLVSILTTSLDRRCSLFRIEAIAVFSPRVRVLAGCST